MKKINFLRRGAGILSMLVVCLCLFVNTSWAQTPIKFTSSGTWTVPAGVYSIQLEAVGGGGAGGHINNAFNDGDGTFACSGGGGGAYAKVNSYSVTPGQILTITVGEGGDGREYPNYGGGGDSYVTIGGTTIILAKGASDVPDNTNTTVGLGGQATACIGDIKISGGNGGKGSTGAWCGSGGGGAAGGTNGGNGAKRTWEGFMDLIPVDHPGAGGTTTGTYCGNGATGVISHVLGTKGENGANYGGGGSGGATGMGLIEVDGGNGAPGIVVITPTIVCDATPGTIAFDEWVCTSTDTTIILTNATSASSSVPGTYSWQYRATTSDTWSTIASADAPYYVVNQNGYYRRGYTAEGCDPVYTASTTYVQKVTTTQAGYVLYNGNATPSFKGYCVGGAANVTLTPSISIAPERIQWQTASNINGPWTDIATGNSYTYSGTISDTVYIRYCQLVSSTCHIPSNNIFTIAAWKVPTVSSISTPTDICPGLSSYNVTASINYGSSSTISTYTWTGATGDRTGLISATLPNCGQTYNYSLKVKDANGCESAVKSGSFTTNNPSDSLSKITSLPQQTAELNGVCIFKAPTTSTLNALNDALKAACGNVITAFTYSASTPLNAGASSNYYINTITDMCGAHSGLNIQVPVKAPDGPTMTVVAVDTFLCPNATTTLSANTTSTDLTYDWTPGHATTSTLTVTGENNGATAVEKTYSLTITDANGCTATDDITIVTAPKAYLQNVTFPPACMPDTASINPNTIAGNIIPNGNDGTYTYQTGYSWWYDANDNVTGKERRVSSFYYPTNTTDSIPLGILNNTSLTTQTVTYTIHPRTRMYNSSNEFLLGCDAAEATVEVLVKPSVENLGAITDFQDGTDTIVLWYGFCDTLHVITPPAYQNHIDPADLTITLSNSKGGTTNTGAFFGRMQPGVDYVITWTLEDECGHKLEFVKHYMVIYPNCGDNDPNFSVHPYVAIDADGIQYPTVRIGCECWIAENLQTVTGAAVSKAYKSDMYPDEVANVAKFGRLYSWYTAVGVTEGDDNAVPTVITEPSSKLKYVNGVCPTGWALPSMADLNNMVNLAGGVNNVKSADQSTWLPGAAGTDLSGFDAVGAGYYDPTTDLFLNLLGETNFWSMENATITQGKCGQIAFTCPEFISKEVAKGMGFSVRCLRRANP